ncbi:hypothetical protein J27TS7_50550 [Paenibacillus dendritiformis]|uniref:hypothetical protein n=1 Tax=Paenibacillus dendritiformis TaxID=130049 RepID=UPI001B2D17D0|nr:hypothetical protein [Paenibacillus dendritiformis]GIO75541.1 hypothetical protein J27TS7_50550 [Paenibacillus dendritiformis]
MRRKRNIFSLCAICLIVSIALSACTSKSTPYLSITLTTSKEDQVVSQIYQYEIGKQKVKLAGEVPYTSQYPLGVYDAGNEIIYYSSRTSDGKSDQLFSMDLKTGKIEQLTTELYAINHVVVVDGMVIMDASFKDSYDNHIKPIVSYHPQTKELKPWWDLNKDDTTVWDLKYNEAAGTIYAAIYSWKEDFGNVVKANKLHIKPEPPLYTVKEYDVKGNEIKELFHTKEELVFFSLAHDGKTAIYGSAPYVNTPRHYTIVDLATGQEQLFTVFEAISDAFFEPDDSNVLLVLGIYKDKRGVYRYDRVTGNVELLLAEPEKDGAINNFTIMVE